MKVLRYTFVPILVFTLSVGLLHGQVQIDSITSTPVTCGNGSDGTLTVYISGGTGPFTYTLFLGATQVESSDTTSVRSFTFSGHVRSLFYLVVVEDGDPVVIGLDNELASISGPDPISILSFGSTDISCHDANDGTISVTAAGEGGNFDYELAHGGPVLETNQTGEFSGLPAGTLYTVTVRDADGCSSSDVTPVLEIKNPELVTITTDDITHVACYGENTGSISISPLGGTPSGSGSGYTYDWTGPNGFTSSSEDINDLEAGDYFVTVYDANLCSANEGPIAVTQEAELTALLDGSTDVTCYDGADGTAQVTAGGGVGGYTFSWEGQNEGLISTLEDPNILVADIYDLTVFDSNGCSRTFSSFATIDEPAPFNIVVDGTTDVNCNGGSDGTAAITPSGGTPAYSFLWTGATTPYTSTDEDPVNMPADVYNLTLTDANGCSEVFNGLLTIDEPSSIAVVVNGTTQVNCFGGSDGTADVTVSGGSSPFSFSWTGDLSGHTSGLEDPDDLPADTYDLTVTDDRGCTEVFNNLVTITEPADLSVTVEDITNVDCNGASTGAIDITPAGGTPGYSFLWTGPGVFSSTAEDISNLGAGSYSVTITDSRGCSNEFINVATVSENTPITATFSLTDISCNGGSDGSIDATVSGGTPGYVFSWSGPSGFADTTEDISGLLPGSYELTVTDALGCAEVMPSQSLIEPAAVTAAVASVDIDCFGADNGSVDLTPAGGTAPYTFAWTGPGTFTASSEDISNLGPGNYSVTVTDAALCATLFTDIATILEPAEVQVNSVKTDISCNGLTDGAIEITATGGTLPFVFEWTGPGGFTSSSEDLSGLGPGDYNLTLTDGNGCVLILPGLETIIEPVSINAAYVSHQDVLCNGGNDGSIEIDVTDGTPPYTFNWTNSLGTTQSADEDPAGLPAETYSLAITDANGCTVSFPDMVIIDEPSAITSSLSKTDLTCYGDGDGTITVTTSGGVLPYVYSRVSDIGPYQPGNSFTGLGPGLYTIWTRDANLCTVTDTITLTEPEELQIIEEVKGGQNLCYGDSSGQISINIVTGGVLPYEYSINGGVDFYPSGLFTNLPAGNYQTVVRDAGGCTAAGNLNVITQPSRLRIDTYLQEDITTCHDAPEGRIVIVGTGGKGTITYSLDGAAPVSPGDFQNLLEGTYLVTMVDENGCTRDTTVIILAPPMITVDNVVITDVTGCPGDATGSVTVTGSGGTGPIKYAMDGGNFTGNGTFNGLTAGSYTITLKDNNDCTLDTLITIGEPGAISILTENVTRISCAGAGDGMIEIVATGGTAPLTYTLDPGAISNGTGIFSGLMPDTYTVSVEDSEGCGPVISPPLTLVDPPALVLDSVLMTDISCYGAGNGTISMYPSGGTPPYEYSVDDQANWSADSVISGLVPGTYEVYIRDANLCLLYGGSIIMSDPPELTLTVVTTDIAACPGDTTGVIEATGLGGTGNLEYSIDSLVFQSGGTFNNLAAGSFNVYVRDEGGCIISETVVINEPARLTATITKTDAILGNLGSITISGTTGGTPPYQYSISGPAGTFSADTVYTDLVAGTYPVVVEDLAGCTYEEDVEILDVLPLDMVIESAHVSCFGADDGSIEFLPQNAAGQVEYSIDSGSSFVNTPLFENLPGDSTYYLVAIDGDGKEYTGSVTLTEPSEIILSRTIKRANCNAFSQTGAIDVTLSGGSGLYGYLWSDGSTDEDRSNIVAGTYILETTDSNSCLRRDTFKVGSLVIVDVEAGQDTAICSGGSVQLNGLGGYTPSWTPSDFLSDPGIANPLASRITETTTFMLTLSEDVSPYGCYNRDSVTVSVHPLVGLDPTGDTVIEKGASVQLDAGGGAFNSYRWDPATGLDNANIPDPVATPLQSVRYYVYGTTDLGCEEVDSVYIEVLDVIHEIRAYNVFSPNGDGINDYFDIENASDYPEMVVEVYSRWGDLLFSTVGYDDASRWDGTARGKDVPVGTYYYIIIPYIDAKPITGNVTIIR